MVEYDPEEVRSFADRLYGRARGLTAALTLAGLGAGWRLPALLEGEPGSWWLIGLGGILGFLVGRALGLGPRLEAQKALTQLEIARELTALHARLSRLGWAGDRRPRDDPQRDEEADDR